MDSTRLDCSGVMSVSPETMRFVTRGEEGPVSLVKIFLSTANLTHC